MDNKLFSDWIDYFEAEGFTHVKYIEDLGYCGIKHFIFTTGLCYGLDEIGIEGRWCYRNHADAVEAIKKLNKPGDPDDSNWIKHKGKTLGEYRNPNYKKNE